MFFTVYTSFRRTYEALPESPFNKGNAVNLSHNISVGAILIARSPEKLLNKHIFFSNTFVAWAIKIAPISLYFQLIPLKLTALPLLKEVSCVPS